MNRKKQLLLALVGAVLLTGSTSANQAKPASPSASAPVAPARLVAPVRGRADLGYTRPVTKAAKVNGKDFIVTTIQVKNLANGSIAGLKVDEFWYDKGGNPVTGDTFRYRKPLQPGEVITVELRTPRGPNMNSNKYNFSHANGDIVPKLMAKF